MNQSSAIKYLLANGLTVELSASREISHVAIERAVMSFYGFNEDLDEPNGVAFWHKGEQTPRAFVSRRNPEVSEDNILDLAQSAGCVMLDLMNDAGIAQDLVKDLGLLMTPITFRNGSLTGRWRVERISNYQPWDSEVNGIITGANQPVATESANLLHAVYATATRVMGVGKLAFITFPQGAEGEAQLIACDFELVGQLEPWIDKTIFRAPELDQYITCNAPEEAKGAAIAVARVKCRAAIVEKKA